MRRGAGHRDALGPVESLRFEEEQSLWPFLKLSDGGPLSATKALDGLVILVGWVVFLRATHRSLGAIGLFLALAFFAILIWLLIEQGWSPSTAPAC